MSLPRLVSIRLAQYFSNSPSASEHSGLSLTHKFSTLGMLKKYAVNSGLYGTTHKFTSRVSNVLTCSDGANEERSHKDV
jgi:hypothetical protein